jgi:nucleotide-binding universal stress UspA family protein
MKKILVPLDFSDSSLNALETARQLAAKSGAGLRLIHVNEFTFHELAAQEISRRHKELLHALIHEEKFKKLDVSYDVLEGPLISTLQEEAEDVDLIVSGATGASGFEEVMMGSNAEKIVRHAPCPVLTVKDILEIEKVRTILLASDLESDQDVMVKPLKAFQQLLGATLHILLVVTPQRWLDHREIKERMEGFVERNKLENFTVHSINDTDEEDAILYYAGEIRADVIAMGTHSRSGLAHLFKGSITEDVVNHAQRAVWTYSLKK